MGPGKTDVPNTAARGLATSFEVATRLRNNLCVEWDVNGNQS